MPCHHTTSGQHLDAFLLGIILSSARDEILAAAQLITDPRAFLYLPSSLSLFDVSLFGTSVSLFHIIHAPQCTRVPSCRRAAA
jgi:hypothetical protein